MQSSLAIQAMQDMVEMSPSRTCNTQGTTLVWLSHQLVIKTLSRPTTRINLLISSTDEEITRSWWLDRHHSPSFKHER